MHPSFPDFALALLFAVVWPAWAALVSWPRLVRALADGRPGVRGRMYVTTMVEQWGLAALVLARHAFAHRPLASLGLAVPRLVPGVIAGAIVAALAWVLIRQAGLVDRRADLRERIRRRTELLGPLPPHTPGEMNLFLALSITAGFCEELLFRGALGWLLSPWTGLPLALLLSSVLFGFGHSYQGAKNAVRIGVVGAALAVSYLATGSLWPGVIAHALMDITSGLTVYAAVRERPEETAAA